MPTLNNTAEGGSGTTTVTTGNSGGVSGNAFDTVTIGSGAAITFDNDHAYQTLGYKVVGSASGDAFLTWNTSLGTVGEVWGRLYLYLTALPPGNLNLIRFRLAGSQVARLTIDTAGHVEIRQASNTLLAETTAVVSVNQWVRIEFHVIALATNGTFEARLYNSPNSTSATETVSSTTAPLLNNLDEVQIGQLSVASPSTFWLDNLNINTTAFPGRFEQTGTGSTSGAGALSGAGTKTGIGTGTTSGTASLTSSGFSDQITPDGDFPFAVTAGGEVMLVTGIEPAGWDTFTRTESSTWGTAESGHTWQEAGGSASDRAVSSGAGRITLASSVTTARRQYVDEDLGDCDVLMCISSSQVATGAALLPAVLLRHVDASNFYRLRVHLGLSGVVSLSVARDSTQIASASTEVTYAADDLLWVRARLVGHRVLGRIWRDGREVEPRRWHIDATVASSTIDSGEVGVAASALSGNTNASPVLAFHVWEITNPQRFTVQRSINTVEKSHAAGAAVSLARPTYAGL